MAATVPNAAAQIVQQLAQSYADTHREVGSLADRASVTVTGRPCLTTRNTAGYDANQQTTGGLLAEAVTAGSKSSNGAIPYTAYDSQYPIQPPAETGTGLTTADPLSSGGSGDLGGIGGIGGGGGGGGGTPVHATGYPGLAGTAAAAAAVAAPVAARALSGAGMAAGSMPFMPFMPFAGAGMGGDGAGAGGGRRVPSWLVETEDVWGESTPVTPPVIGEDPGPAGR